jgi:hypothetical protein
MGEIFHKGQGSHITQLAIFKQIWMLSNKKSYISGLFLRKFMNTDLFLNCFAHVLPKAQNKYPYFKYYAGNIALLTPGEHSLWDQGTEEARISYSLDLKEQTNGRVEADWDKLKALETELIKLYKKYFPTTRGLIIGYKYSPEEVIKIVGKLNKLYFEALIKSNKQVAQERKSKRPG